jgi:hypothetical protein
MEHVQDSVLYLDCVRSRPGRCFGTARLSCPLVRLSSMLDLVGLEYRDLLHLRRRFVAAV